MPIHLQSITSKGDDSELFAALLQGALDHSDAAVVSNDQQYLQIAQFITDTISGERIGKLVTTMFRSDQEKELRILDIDIVIDSAKPIRIKFVKKLPPSSDANEYYDVETIPEEQHLQVETVNRYFIERDIENTEQTVRACAFPFKLSVYENVDAMNEALGFKPKRIDELDMTIGGLSNTFTAPAGILTHEGDEGEIYTFLVGTVQSFRDVEISFDRFRIPFVIVQLETALGLLPTAVGRDVFEIETITSGKVIAMKADIKVDFAIDQ